MVEAGHYPHHEQPQIVNDRIARWMQTIVEEDEDFPVPRIPRYKKLELTLKNIW